MGHAGLMNFLSLNISVELTCLVIAFIFLRSDHKFFWKLVIVYMAIVCGTEISGRYIARFMHQPNGWLYNISLFFEIGFIHFALFKFISKYSRFAKFLVLLSLCFISLIYLSEIFYWKTSKFYITTYRLYSVNIVLLSLFYFYVFIKQRDYVILKHDAEFWFVAGILFFFFGGTVMNFLYNVLTIQITPDKTIKSYINNILIILLYGFWSYSFICRHRIAKLHTSLH